MDKPLEIAWVGPQVGWGRVSGNNQGMVNSVSQADGHSDMAPASQRCVCVCLAGNLRKGTVTSASTPALILMPDNSIPPCMSLVPFKLLPQCWNSEGASLSKFVHGLFKRNCLGLQKPVMLSHTLQPEVMGLLFLVLEPWAGELGVRLGPLTPQW